MEGVAGEMDGGKVDREKTNNREKEGQHLREIREGYNNKVNNKKSEKFIES